jgi:DNA-binding response OmpR family regulator
VTTEGALERAQEALAAGANDYLKKPFTPDQLAEKIRPFLT